MSEKITDLAQAFLKAKKEFSATGFSGNNSHQKYKYAKISDIYAAVESALAKHDIIIWHYCFIEDAKEVLATRLIHTLTGQYIMDTRFLETEKPGNQAKGAANTYMRKYAVLSLCAIATEDDDGQDEQSYISQKNNEPTIDPVQLLQLQSLIKEFPNNKLLYNNILKFNGIRDLSSLPQKSFENVKNYILSQKGG